MDSCFIKKEFLLFFFLGFKCTSSSLPLSPGSLCQHLLAYSQLTKTDAPVCCISHDVFSALTTRPNSLIAHHVTIVLCFTVSHRGVLQRKLSIIWLRPGAFRRAWASPRTSVLHRISYLLATAPLQNQEQPRQPVIWFSGLPAVGSVALMTTVRHVNCAASSCLLSHCPSLPSLQTYFVAVVSQLCGKVTSSNITLWKPRPSSFHFSFPVVACDSAPTCFMRT